MLTHQARFCSRAAGAIPSLRHPCQRDPLIGSERSRATGRSQVVGDGGWPDQSALVKNQFEAFAFQGSIMRNPFRWRVR
jgi:hypothetical protein